MKSRLFTHFSISNLVRLMIAVALIGQSLLTSSFSPRAAQAAIRDADNSIDKEAAARAVVDANYGKLPLSFEVNRGQADKQVKFFGEITDFIISASIALLYDEPIIDSMLSYVGSEKQLTPPGLTGGIVRFRYETKITSRKLQKFELQVAEFFAVLAIPRDARLAKPLLKQLNLQPRVDKLLRIGFDLRVLRIDSLRRCIDLL